MFRMAARQRGAFWLLLLLLAGRVLDRLDLPFEASQLPAPADSAFVAADTLRPGAAEIPAPAVETSGALEGDGEAQSLRIAVNRAGLVELQGLPRVGPVLAARIIAEREENGLFHSIQDLQRVPGIGPRTAARLAPLVRFD
jgi:competence ComEA-like helix-hairpin-helix protein